MFLSIFEIFEKKERKRVTKKDWEKLISKWQNGYYNYVKYTETMLNIGEDMLIVYEKLKNKLENK